MSEKAKILVVEDEPDIREILRFNLENEGYKVLVSDSGEKGLRIAEEEKPDLLLLDLMLPGMDGLDVCRKVRTNNELAHCSVIIITAKGEEIDVVTGLELGADDYITKPFSQRVLIARIRSVLRRNAHKETDGSEVINISNLYIHPNKREVKYKGNEVQLTYSEFKTLQFLASHPGWVYSRYQIVDHIHGQGHPITERAVDVMIVSLRKKLGEGAILVETVRGVGYRFRVLD